MNWIYQVLETILPFSWTQYDFMKNAFLAVLFITPLFGLLGTMIVQKKMAFFSDALGHSAFTGIALGVLCSFADSYVSMVTFGVVFALLMNFIKRKQMEQTDTIISVFSSCSIALGLLILTGGGDFSKYSGLIVGDILSISPKEIAYLGIVFVLTEVFWVFGFNRLLEVSIHATLAKSRRLRTGFIENVFVVCIAVIVMISIKWVGILLINALLILPAAASRNISSNMREYHLFSVVFSAFSGITGLIVSYYINVATGPLIVIVAAIIYFATYCYHKVLQN